MATKTTQDTEVESAVRTLKASLDAAMAADKRLWQALQKSSYANLESIVTRMDSGLGSAHVAITNLASRIK